MSSSKKPRKNPSHHTAGSAIFSRLKSLDIDYVFVNSGTDFPPIIEGLSYAAEAGVDVPEAITIPHEHAALGMAHGYYLMTGKAQAVMLHTNVGLSNGATGAINAACEHIPMLLMSGRTPATEEGRFGARTVPIGWGQEMRDQTALVRESSKWDYELKFPEQITGLLDRAYAISNSTPKGPTYLSLPRETLCEPIDEKLLAKPIAQQPVTGAGNAADIAQLAQWIADANAPLIIAQRGAGDKASFDQFSQMVAEWAIPVCSWWATHLALPTDHVCHTGPEPEPFLQDADLVIVLDCLAPWWPDKHPVSDQAKIVHMGPDPLFSRYPVRNFRSDLAIAGENALTIPALAAALSAHKPKTKNVDARRAQISQHKADNQPKLPDPAHGLTKALVGHALSDILKGEQFTVFSELGIPLTSLRTDQHNSWFQEPHSGGLGWSFPTALGAQLADRDHLCVATMGDGSYMFANPTVCHQIAEALELPVLVIILNNEEWGAVRQSVVGMYPDGAAAKTNRMPLTALKPSPDFTQTAAASRCWAKNVTSIDDLRKALADAFAHIKTNKAPALLNVKILPDG